MMETRPLTPSERDRLQPLLDRTEIPIRVTAADMTVTDDEIIPLAAKAVGHWPQDRSIIIWDGCFEQYTDRQLTGLLAHELGHHDGHHILLKRIVKLAIAGLGTVVMLGLLALGFLSGARLQWGVFAGCVAGCVVGFCLVGLLVVFSWPALSRRLEIAADRRGAALLGSTAPLEAMCLPDADLPREDLLTELTYPYPHPADRLAALRK